MNRIDEPHAETGDEFRAAAGPGIWEMAWRHKALLALGLVVGLALGSLYYARAERVYQSATKILVVKKRQDALPLPGMDPRLAQAEDYVSTHLVLIRSPLVA